MDSNEFDKLSKGMIIASVIILVIAIAVAIILEATEHDTRGDVPVKCIEDSSK
jgi:hypothetical protein